MWAEPLTFHKQLVVAHRQIEFRSAFPVRFSRHRRAIRRGANFYQSLRNRRPRHVRNLNRETGFGWLLGEHSRERHERKSYPNLAADH
jgi:hypothetical protein